MSKSKQAKHFEFGPFRLDPAERVLLREGLPVTLAPKAFDTLLVLIQNSGHLVEKDDLMKALWPDTFVEEGNLSFNISVLRKALGEGEDGQPYIETVPRRGYRFVPKVSEGRSGKTELVIRRRIRAHITTTEADEGDLPEALPIDIEPKQLISAENGSKQVWWKQRRATLWMTVAVLTIVVSMIYWWTTRRAQLQEARTVAAIKSLAVLPFKPLSPETSGDEYLGLGISDSLITRLANIKQLNIRPTSAISKYSDANQDPIRAGRQLGVEAVVDGKIQHEDDRIRVTVQLIRVADGVPLWSGAFNEKFTSIFAVQDSISRQVTQALTLHLSDEEQNRLVKSYTESPEAYQEYLKGRYFWNKRVPEGFTKAIEHFQQAIKNDPQYALAYTGLADSYIMRGLYGIAPPRETYLQAREATLKALELDTSLGEAHTSLAAIKLFYDWDFSGAETEFVRALQLNPNHVQALLGYADLLSALGKHEQALAEIQHALRVDPLDPGLNMNLGDFLYFARRYNEAVEQYQKTLDLDHNFKPVYLKLVRVYTVMGKYPEAEASLQRAEEVSVSRAQLLASAARLYSAAGQRDKALKLLIELNLQAKVAFVPSLDFAEVYAVLGERDKAFTWLNKAFEERSDWMILLQVNPYLDGLRDDARFLEISHRLGFAL